MTGILHSQLLSATVYGDIYSANVHQAGTFSRFAFIPLLLRIVENS